MADKRVEKTVNDIRKAFEDLIIEEGDIYYTIKEIAGKANINRKTFYLHFKSIEDLYRDFEEITEKKFFNILNDHNFFSEKFSLTVFLDCLLELIDSNPPLYEKLLIENKFKFVFRNLKDKIKEKIIVNFLNNDYSLKSEMLIEYVFAGLIKLFRVWHAKKDEMSRSEMYKTAYSIIRNGIEILQ